MDEESSNKLFSEVHNNWMGECGRVEKFNVILNDRLWNLNKVKNPQYSVKSDRNLYMSVNSAYVMIST